MDSPRFDALTRALGTSRNRRGALAALAGGGLLGVLGRGRISIAAQAGPCALAVVATIREGPSLGAGANPQPQELRGTVCVALTAPAPTAGIDPGPGWASVAGTFRLADGSTLPIVGATTGPGLLLQIATAQGNIVLTGVGEQAIATCQGTVNGQVAGPQAGDRGDWEATAQQGGCSAVPVPAANTTTGPVAPLQVAPPPAGTTQTTGQTAGQGQTTSQTPTPTPTPTSTSTSTPPPTPTSTPTPTSVSTACPAGQTDCGGVCVDLMNDRNNCGLCSLTCLFGQSCSGGQCGTACAASQLTCGGLCVDPMSDPAHCGGCGASCGAGQVCEGGTCSIYLIGVDVCDQGTVDCGGLCVDTTSDSANCGGCGVVCLSGQSCDGGQCLYPLLICAANEQNCGGVCVDLSSDSAHCGGCGVVCSADEVCQGGQCVRVNCAPPGADCTNGSPCCSRSCSCLAPCAGGIGTCD